jgi:hypothetical protein
VSAPTPDRRAVQWGWFALFVANLPLPLAFALDVTREGGAFGMCAALALLWWCGHVLAPHAPKLSGRVAVGGVLLAFGQFVLVGHVLAGFAAMFVVESLSPGEAGALSEVQGFFVTVLTAGELLLAALAMGTVILGFDQAPSEAEPAHEGSEAASLE